MDISLNNQFLQSFSLTSTQDTNRLMLRLPVLQGLLDGKTDVSIPALKLGAINQLRFDFQYMNRCLAARWITASPSSKYRTTL